MVLCQGIRPSARCKIQRCSDHFLQAAHNLPYRFRAMVQVHLASPSFCNSRKASSAADENLPNGGRPIGVRLVAIVASPAESARRTTDRRLDGFDVQAQALKPPANKRPQRQFVFQAWMCLQRACTSTDGLAILIDLCGQRFDTITSGANLRQDFNAAAIVNSVFVRDRIPQGQAMFAKLARWCIAGRRRIDEG
jgi:hypothetical protein